MQMSYAYQTFRFPLYSNLTRCVRKTKSKLCVLNLAFETHLKRPVRLAGTNGTPATHGMSERPSM